MNRAFLTNNGQEKHFKLQTNKLKSFEIEVPCTFLKVTEIDWHSIHIHILRNFFTNCRFTVDDSSIADTLFWTFSLGNK